MTSTLTGPIGAAISTPMPMPASTSWMVERTICAPACKARAYSLFERGAEAVAPRRAVHGAHLRSLADLRD